MTNGYATGVEVTNLPPWLREITGEARWRYLEVGVCEVCELRGQHRWQTMVHGYVYCRQCIVAEHDERGPFAAWVLLGP